MHNLSNLSFAVTAGVGGLLCIFAGFDVGGLTVFCDYARRFSFPINNLSMQMSTVFSALAGAERVFAVMDEEPETPDRVDAIRMGDVKGEVVLDSVTFGYLPGQTVLRNVSLYAHAGQKIAFTMEADFPWNGKVKITFEQPAAFRLMLRKPWWAKGYSLTINGEKAEGSLENGYLVLERAFAAGDVVALDLPMEVRFMNASLRSPNYVGKAALMRGPVVYCLEENDNGAELWNLSVKAGEAETAHRDDLLGGVTTITCQGQRTEGESDLYHEDAYAEKARQLNFVPYYAWGNRGKGEMAVWVRKA
jgi:hypothetical protein